MPAESKPAVGSAPAAEPAASAPALEVTLGEFCASASGRGVAVEILGGFHADRTAAGHHKDTHEGFSAAFDAFASRPVG